MSDLAIDPKTGRFVIQHGDVQLVRGTEATAQRLAIRASTFKGNLFFAPSTGIAYFKIVGQQLNQESARALFRAEIRRDPDVVHIEDPIQISFDTKKGRLTLSARVRIRSGDTIEVQGSVDT